MTEENNAEPHVETNDDLVLGGSITLSGFKAIGRSELVVVKKMIGSYVRKLSDNVEGFESIKLTLKVVHKTEGSEKYELHANAMVKNKPITSMVTDRNVFVGLDEVLKNLELLAMKQ